jgi:hypothetical protein
MFQEPQILHWLARKAGVPFPEARAIWHDIASKGEAERSDKSGDSAWRQLRDLRRQLGERGRGSAAGRLNLDWMFPLPLFQTWAECQTRIVVNAWLAWATPVRATAEGSFVDRTSRSVITSGRPWQSEVDRSPGHRALLVPALDRGAPKAVVPRHVTGDQ